MGKASDKRSSEPAPTTPGRPKETGSRQQTVPNQNSQSGSTETDKSLVGKDKTGGS
jgi:hypothetical protein